MKFTHVVMMVAVVAAMMFVAGCTSQAPKYDNPDAAAVAQHNAEDARAIANAKAAAKALDNPYVFSSETTTGKYGRVEVTGVIYNPTDSTKKVFGYVDYYQNGVKVDDGIFSCTPDAHGKATFKSSTSDVEAGDYEYKVRITNVYKA